MRSAVTGVLCLLSYASLCQTSAKAPVASSIDSTISPKISEKYITDMGSRSAEYQAKMQEATTSYLSKLQAQEQVLQQQLNKTNPDAASKIFSGSTAAYDKIQSDLKNNSASVLNSYGRYVPGIDSAVTSLKFLQQGALQNSKLASQSAQIQTAMSKVTALEAQFKKADNVQDFIKQREQYLQQQLSSYNLPGLQKFQTQAAYFGQEIQGLKQDWQDPSRMEAKAVALLNKLPAYQQFMQRNSAIANLFNVPSDYGTQSVAGLQTKDVVQKAMQQNIGMMGPKGAETASANIADGQSALSDLRSKLNQGSSELAMPEGQVNGQHTKSLFRRIEYGLNLQSTQSTFYFPSQTQFSFTAAYKINDNNTAGIGINYSVGWGRDIQHISVTNQGIGFKGFASFKIKGTIYGTGEYDYDYAYPFASINQLKTSDLWQLSGLVGITKVIPVKSALVKKTQVQLLWNYLSYFQTFPQSPFVFRVGYAF
jgi:hypothetical protein